MRLEETRISFKISFLEKQIEASKQLEINFPSMKKKILIVEDEAEIAQLMQLYLEKDLLTSFADSNCLYDNLFLHDCNIHSTYSETR